MQPEKIGKYEKLEQIGYGSTAAVWRAKKPSLRRECALKIFHSEAPDTNELFEEARIMIKLGVHPHLVQVYDADVMDGLPVIVMEYVNGQPAILTDVSCLNIIKGAEIVFTYEVDSKLTNNVILS